MDDALIACGIPGLGKAKEHPRLKAELGRVMARAASVRRMGAAALDLAGVAAGRYDAYWEHGLNSWDIAAGALLVREAGGFVTTAEGGDGYMKEGSVCAGNDIIHRELLKLLRGP